MSDLIDRRAVLQIIDEWYDDKADIEDLIVRITYMPSATPTERVEYGTDGNAYKLSISNGKEFEPTERTGHWTNRYNEVFKYYCDKCGTGSDLRTNFCPNCGADMRGKDSK